MGSIEVDPDRVEAVGGQVVGLVPDVARAGSTVRSVGGRVLEPAATAAALDFLASEWAAGAARLEADVLGLGRAAEVAGALYRTTDADAIPISPP